MRWLFLTSVFVFLFSLCGCSGPTSPEGAAGAGPSNKTNPDLENLQGKWRIESSIWNGIEDPPIAKMVSILFQDDQFIIIDRDGNRMQERIQLLPDKNPKAINCWSKDGEGKPNPGIYTLEGDTFTWCSAAANNKFRPTSFDSKPGSKHSLVVLRREKS